MRKRHKGGGRKDRRRTKGGDNIRDEMGREEGGRGEMGMGREGEGGLGSGGGGEGGEGLGGCSEERILFHSGANVFALNL